MRICIFVFAILLGFSQLVQADENLSAQEVVKKSSDLYRSVPTEIAKVSMQTGKKTLSFDFYAKYSPDGKDKIVMAYHDAKVFIISWDGDGETKIRYKKSRRNKKFYTVNIDDKKYHRQTCLTVRDLKDFGRPNIEDYEFSFVEGDGSFFHIAAVAKRDIKTAYAKMIFKIDYDYAIRQIDFFHGSDKSISLLKTLKNEEIEISKSGAWRAKKTVVSSDRLGKTTKLRVESRKFVENISSRYFREKTWMNYKGMKK